MLISPLNPSYFGRFKIFEDFVLTLPDNGIYPQPLVREKFMDLHGHHIKWDSSDANGALIANARRGHIFVAFFYAGQSAAAGVITQSTANPPGIQMYTRLRFRDTV